MIVVDIAQTAADIATWPAGHDIVVVLGNSANGIEAMPFAGLGLERLDGRFLGDDRWQMYFVALVAGELGVMLSLLFARADVRGIVLADELQAVVAPLCVAIDPVADVCGVIDTLCRSQAGWHGHCTAGAGVLDALQSVRHRDVRGADVILIGGSALGRCVAAESMHRLCRSLSIVDPEDVSGWMLAEQLRTGHGVTPIHVVAEPGAVMPLVAQDAAILVVDPLLVAGEMVSLLSNATKWVEGRDCFVVFREKVGGGRPFTNGCFPLGQVLAHSPHRFVRVMELFENMPGMPAEPEAGARSSPCLAREASGHVFGGVTAPDNERRRKWRTTQVVAWGLAAAICVGFFFLTVRFRVTGASMEPNLRSGDYVLAVATKSPLSGPRRGDIVVFAKPGDEVEYVKRVIGLPGEVVQIKDGRVWIGDVALAEPYAQGATTSSFAQVNLGPDEYFLLGDHRALSRDSRNLGPVRRSEILGRAVLVCWPWSRWRLLVTQ